MTASRRLIALLALAVLAGACGADESATSGETSQSAGPAAAGSGEASPSGSTGSPTGSPDPSPGGDAFQNPVLDANFADPFVLPVGDRWYAYATGNLTYNIQWSEADDLVSWSRPREALPRLPVWQPSSKGLTWAPEVIETDAGFVMHYTARDVQAGRQCLAVAVAESPDGPYVDASTEPLLCQVDLGGSIDSSPFRDADGTLWLVWKNDGNCCGMRTRFFLQALTPDGTGLTGEAVDLGVTNDAPWERNLIEAPTLWLHDGTYYLFYSANDYGSDRYAVGYAVSDDLDGPYTDAAENPILSSAGSAAGPGHQSIVEDDDGDLWMVYHAWDASRVGDSLGGRRALWIDPLAFEDGKPVVQGPNDAPQPLP